MGSARVQYELERTLPTLQLAVHHGLFDKNNEARSITHKRRQFESALVRHNALEDDFHRYVEYEDNIERLRLMRVKRLGDASEIPRADLHEMQQQSNAHVISIFERGIRRIRHAYDLWHRYMLWAMQRKMRGAVSRIAARALALFPNNIDLWLFIADNALNQTMDVTTARALLQRALRLNGIAHKDAIAAAKRTKRPVGKRARLITAATPLPPLAIRPAGNEHDDTPTLQVSAKETQVVRMWLEYFRLELVFLERLRRRQAVLNILDDGAPVAIDEVEDAAAVASEKVPESTDGEAVPTSLERIVSDEALESGEAAKPADTIILGAIPIAALKSAVSLDATTALPPRLHFPFLSALTEMILAFPFHGDCTGLQVRSRLLTAIQDALQARFPSQAIAMLMSCAIPVWEEARRSGMERLSDVDRTEELHENILLRRASRLIHKEKRELNTVLQTTTNDDDDKDQERGAANTIFAQTSHALQRIQEHARIASLARSVLDQFRKDILALDEPSDVHFSSLLSLVERLRVTGMDMEMGEEFYSFLTAYSHRVVRDANKLGVVGKLVKQAQLRGQLNTAVAAGQGDSESFDAVIRAAMLEYSRESDLNFIYLAADALLAAATHSPIAANISTTVWPSIFKAVKGKNDVHLWSSWCTWLDKAVIQHSSVVEETMWKRHQIKSALREFTVGETAAQHVLMVHLYEQEAKASGAHETLVWIRGQGIAQAPFWQHVVAGERARLARMKDEETSGEEERRKQTVFLKSIFEEWIKMTAGSPDAMAEYLRFLCVDASAEVEAMERFKKDSAMLARISVEGQKHLEARWKAILQDMQASEEVESETEEDGQSNDGAGDER